MPELMLWYISFFLQSWQRQ